MTRLQLGSDTSRIQAVWGKWADVRPQAQSRTVPLRARVRLLGSVILPTLLWSLESLQLSVARSRSLGGLQRCLVGRTLLLLRRSTESVEEYFARRERG